MTGIATMMEQLVIDSLVNDHLPPTLKNNTGQGILALSAFFATLGLGFILYGGYLWLSASFAPEIAMAISGVFSLIVAALIMGAALLALKFRQSRMRQFRHSLGSKIQDALANLDEDFGDPIRANPKIAVLLAALAGFLLEDRLL